MIRAGQKAIFTSYKNMLITREPKESALEWNYWFQLFKIFAKNLLLKSATCQLPLHMSGEWWALQYKLAIVPRTNTHGLWPEIPPWIISFHNRKQLVCFPTSFSFPLRKTSVSNESRGEWSSHLAERTGQLRLCQAVQDCSPHWAVLNGKVEADKVLLEHPRDMSELMAVRIFSDEKLTPRNNQF